MPFAKTETFGIANGWINLGTQAKADGYQGSPIAKSVTVVNFNATVAYLHLTDNGATNPTTAADGLPLSSDVAVAPSAAFSAGNVDINTIWIHSAGTQNIKYAVIGA